MTADRAPTEGGGGPQTMSDDAEIEEGCPHDTVDESWIQPRRWRRITLYREWCLDCNARRRREFKRFRWGRWTQWVEGEAP